MKHIANLVILSFIGAAVAQADDYLGNYSTNPYTANSTSNPTGPGARITPTASIIDCIATESTRSLSGRSPFISDSDTCQAVC